LLVIGLANSGKTTLVNALRAARRETVKSRSTTTVTPKKKYDEEVVPTMGFAVERFSVLNTTLTVVDMSGQSKYKDTLWECYYEDANAVVFVVDAAESEENVDAARAALEFFLSSPNAEKTGDAKKKKKAPPPLAVFANKSDLPSARSASELASLMRLTGESEALKDRAWHVGACCARTGEGVRDGFRWLIEKS
jgi:small GTP-binding protein